MYKEYMKNNLLILLLFILFSCTKSSEIINIETHIKNHQFSPNIITAKESQVIRLTIFNDDPTVEEFESYDLKREKIVPSNNNIIITIGPLKKGSYKFFGDFHQETAQGEIIIE